MKIIKAIFKRFFKNPIIIKGGYWPESQKNYLYTVSAYIDIPNEDLKNNQKKIREKITDLFLIRLAEKIKHHPQLLEIKCDTAYGICRVICTIKIFCNSEKIRDYDN